jgi:hypothetical protein
MGTSRNDRSPDTPPWRLTLASLGAAGVPAERQGQEIWRAALADRGERLRDQLGQAFVGEVCRLAARAKSATEALGDFDRLAHERRAVGLAVEMARRALARAAASQGGLRGFSGEFFAEATSYYAARDLPSVIGRSNRIESPYRRPTVFG